MSALLRTAMSDTATATTSPEGTAYRARLKRMDWKLEAFAGWLGVHKATLVKWWQGGPPLYAVRVLELLEATFVMPAKPDQDARLAMFSPFSSTIDTARAAGWTRPQIAAVMRQMADELEGPVAPRE